MLNLFKALKLLAASEHVSFAIESLRGESKLGIEDWYKWLFQAVNGFDTSPLEHVWRTMGDAPPDEPATVPLRRDKSLVRLNLRPFRNYGGELRSLTDARSGPSDKKRSPEFESVWKTFAVRLKAGDIGGVTIQDWVELDELTRTNGYPCIDHSADYKAAARPAYVVLEGCNAEKLLRHDSN
jgi:hypothetical protein